MSARLARLLIREPGSTTWIDLDPNTPAGRLAMRRLQINLNPEGTSTMTATATRLSQPQNGKAPDLSGVPQEQKSLMQMGLLVQMKQGAQRLYNRLAGAARGAWGWIRSTFHLDAAAEVVKDGYHYAADKVAVAGRFLGTSGGAGLGMLAVSTHTGRRLMGYVLKPVGWILRKIGAVFAWTEAALRNDTNGGIRNWVADRMADSRFWAFGTGVGSEHGVIGNAMIWTAKNVGPYLDVDALAMRGTRAVAVALLASKFVPLLGMLPYGTVFMTVAYAIVGMIVLDQFEPEIDKALHWAEKKLDDAGDTIQGVATEAGAIEDTTGKAVVADINAAVKASAGAVPTNRVSKRAAAKARR